MNELLNPLEYIPKFLKITTKADERGMSSLVPMKLFPVQEEYIKNRTRRDIILKARQMGISTGILAHNFQKVVTQPYTKMVIVAHRFDSAKFLLQTVHRFYNNLPPELQPEIDWSSSKWIRFPLLDCFIHVDSAEATTIGRAESLNIIHLSEVAQWYEPNVTELYAGISQTISEGAYLTLESTPHGRGNFFFRMYEAAKRGDIPYKPFFFPWWFVSEYRLPVPHPLTLEREEQQLVNNYNLTLEHIAWRRLKIAELGDIFYQEYPENDSDCWLSSEINVFDGIAIRRHLRNVRAGTKEGNLIKWKGALGGRKYIIGADPAAGLPRGDYSAAVVLDVRNNEHIATLRGRIPPDLFTQELLSLGRQYNMALIAVERENHGHTVLQLLLQQNYPNIYYHKDYAPGVQTSTHQPGWMTSGKTRPIMIDTFGSSLKSDSLTTYSENLLKEASSFQQIGQKIQPPSGSYDDELFAMMIALSVRELNPTFDSIPRYRPITYMRV